MSPAIREALRRKEAVFPLLRVDWRSRGRNLGERLYAPGGTVMADGAPTAGKVILSGFGPITYGGGVKGGTLAIVRTSVKIEDLDQTLASMLEMFDPRGSEAQIAWATASMLQSDWDTKLLGIVEDWSIVDRIVEVFVKTDDAPLRAPAPKPIFSKAEDSTATETAIFGTAQPVVFGFHDSFKVTARGMVPATNIAYDDLLGFKWLASLGNVQVDRVYFDGNLQTAGVYSITRGVYGSTWRTIIDVLPALKPEKSVIVSWDGHGPDANGLLIGTAITNPARILRTFLNEYVYRDNRLGTFTGDHAIIDTASWDATEAHFNLHGYEAAIRIGGEGDRPEAYKVVEDFLRAHPFVRMWWTPLGQIAISIVRYEDVDPTGEWIRADIHTAAKDFVYKPGDRREVYSGIVAPYLYSSSEGKFIASIEAHDLSVAINPEDRTVLKQEMTWSSARYDLGA